MVYELLNSNLFPEGASVESHRLRVLQYGIRGLVAELLESGGQHPESVTVLDLDPVPMGKERPASSFHFSC